MPSSCCTASRGEVPSADPATGSPSRAPAPSPVHDRHGDLVRLDGGTFLMGSEDPDAHPADGEGPVRETTVEPFAIGRAAVSNGEFSAFVDGTGYVTEAERFGWSFVFAAFLPASLRKGARRPAQTPWWVGVPGAYWRAPEGPGSGVGARETHPVVHVSWQDATAYARWAGARLPTEVEWEYAARGGLTQARYPWGDELTPGGEHMCNIWQGTFPSSNTAEDGYRGTAPVDSFSPNGYGLYNVAGNVWEMCTDAWSVPAGLAGHDVHAAAGRRVMRGGSYLCHSSYCNRYRVAARTSNTADSSAGNQGFRLAVSV